MKGGEVVIEMEIPLGDGEGREGRNRAPQMRDAFGCAFFFFFFFFFFGLPLFFVGRSYKKHRKNHTFWCPPPSFDPWTTWGRPPFRVLTHWKVEQVSHGGLSEQLPAGGRLRTGLVRSTWASRKNGTRDTTPRVGEITACVSLAKRLAAASLGSSTNFASSLYPWL